MRRKATVPQVRNPEELRSPHRSGAIPNANLQPVWGALDTYRLYQNVVAADTLYTLMMTTEVCETLGLATVPREVTPGLRPVMEIAGVPEDLINWSASRRQRIEDALQEPGGRPERRLARSVLGALRWCPRGRTLRSVLTRKAAVFTAVGVGH